MPTASPIQNRSHAPAPLPPARSPRHQHADERGADEAVPTTVTARKASLARRAQADAAAQQLAQHPGERGVAAASTARLERMNGPSGAPRTSTSAATIVTKTAGACPSPPSSIQAMASAGCGFHGVMLNGPTGSM
jgi:hypothetical protein